MPIYDFRCQRCGKVTEFLLSSRSDGKRPACPGCGSRNLERLISAPSLLGDTTDSGATCCGRAERCDKPPCPSDGKCTRE